jgi:acetyltransferase
MTKPIIVIKPGRTEGAAKAAASHTGSLTGSDEVLEVAFRRSGVLRVNSIAELFYMAEVLGKQPRPKGPRLTILTNAGGPGVLATDALITGGGELAKISPEAMEEFNKLLPAAWSHNNPVDILGDASPERYGKALEIAAKDPNTDGILVILTPQAMTDPTKTAEELKPYAQSLGKPIIATWMGGNEVAPGEAILNKANIPTFPYPDTAARVFDYMAHYSENLHSLYETPMSVNGEENDQVDREQAAQIIKDVRDSGRTILTEYESKQLLSCYGIPTVDTRIAKSEKEAVKAADAIGYPVVLKIHSETITHKTDVGGVQLNLADAKAVKNAYESIEKSVTEKVGAEHFLGVTVQPMAKIDGYELILGSSIDSQFGPVLLFGLGGQLVEVFKDRALGLPPLTTTLARRMMEQTRIYTALKGVRGRDPVDLVAVERLLVRFSQLVTEQRWIKELDINPLIA